MSEAGGYSLAVFAQLDEPGTIYYMVAEAAQMPSCPGSSRVFAGNYPSGVSGPGPTGTGTFAVSDLSGAVQNITDLKTETAYTVCLIAEDTTSYKNRQTRVTQLDSATRDVTPPGLTVTVAPGADGDMTCSRLNYSCGLSFTLSVNETGIVRYLLVRRSAVPLVNLTSALLFDLPAASLFNATDVLADAVISLDANATSAQAVPNLPSQTDYNLLLSVADAAGNVPASPRVVAVSAPDIRPPFFTVATASSPDDTRLVGTLALDEPGTVFYLVLPTNSTPTLSLPTADQVVAGALSGANVVSRGSLAVPAAGANVTLALTALARGTFYTLCLVPRDATGNTQTFVTTLVGRTIDSTPPVLFSLSTLATPPKTTFAITANVSKPGTIYYVGFKPGAPAPSRITDILFPSPAANFSGSFAVGTALTLSDGVLCIADGQQMEVYAFAQDNEGRYEGRLPNNGTIVKAVAVVNPANEPFTCKASIFLSALQLQTALTPSSPGFALGPLRPSVTSGGVSFQQDFGGFVGQPAGTADGLVEVSVGNVVLPSSYRFQVQLPRPTSITLVARNRVAYLEDNTDAGRTLSLAYQLQDALGRTHVDTTNLTIAPVLEVLLPGRELLNPLPPCAVSELYAGSGIGSCLSAVPVDLFPAEGATRSANLYVNLYNGLDVVANSSRVTITLTGLPRLTAFTPASPGLLVTMPYRCGWLGVDPVWFRVLSWIMGFCGLPVWLIVLSFNGTSFSSFPTTCRPPMFIKFPPIADSLLPVLPSRPPSFLSLGLSTYPPSALKHASTLPMLRAVYVGETFRVTLTAEVPSASTGIEGWSLPVRFRSDRVAFVSATPSGLWPTPSAVISADGGAYTTLQLTTTGRIGGRGDNLYRGTVQLVDVVFQVLTPSVGDLDVVNIKTSLQLFPFTSGDAPPVQVNDHRGGVQTIGNALVQAVQQLALFVYAPNYDVFNLAVFTNNDVVVPISAVAVSSWGATSAAAAPSVAPQSCEISRNLTSAFDLDRCRVIVRSSNTAPARRGEVKVLYQDLSATLRVSVWYPSNVAVAAEDPILNRVLPQNAAPAPPGCNDRYQRTRLRAFARFGNGGSTARDVVRDVDISRWVQFKTSDPSGAQIVGNSYLRGLALRESIEISLTTFNDALRPFSYVSVVAEPVCLLSVDVLAFNDVTFNASVAGGRVGQAEKLSLSMEPQQNLTWEGTSAYVRTFASFSDGNVQDITDQVCCLPRGLRFASAAQLFLQILLLCCPVATNPWLLPRYFKPGLRPGRIPSDATPPAQPCKQQQHRHQQHNHPPHPRDHPQTTQPPTDIFSSRTRRPTNRRTGRPAHQVEVVEVRANASSPNPFALGFDALYAVPSARVNQTVGDSPACGRYLAADWSVCSAVPMGRGSGTVSTSLPLPVAVSTFNIDPTTIANPVNAASKPPISIATNATTSVFVSFSDGTIRNFTSDPRLSVVLSQGADTCVVYQDEGTGVYGVRMLDNAVSRFGRCELRAAVAFPKLAPQVRGRARREPREGADTALLRRLLVA